MTDGIASSSCILPIRDVGEIVSVFGHEHEIGKSIRMTLNPGAPDERILLDIPDWDFDWQYNYYPTESIMVERGDSVLLECSWDRSRRSVDLEPAYVLWADGTNDEMCFATIAVRGAAQDDDAISDDSVGIDFALPDGLGECMSDAGVGFDGLPGRDAIDATVDQLFVCAEPAEVGNLLATLITENFGGLVSQEGTDCIAEAMATPAGARSLLVYVQPDSTEVERLPVGEIVGDCVSLSEAVVAFGLPIPEEAFACIDESGRDLLVQAAVDGELPDVQVLFNIINPCVSEVSD